MRANICVLAGLVGLASPATADNTPSAASIPPDGWALNNDGSYLHAQSGVICAKIVGTYNFVRFGEPSDPNILGTCVYSGGDVRVGEIRVRKFVDGMGETPLAIQNDRVLMGVAPMANAPPGAKVLSAHRVGPGPEINGEETTQVVLTSARSGLLVDCISLTKRDKAEIEYGFKNFDDICAFSKP
jgi:hypothetical protein